MLIELKACQRRAIANEADDRTHPIELLAISTQFVLRSTYYRNLPPKMILNLPFLDSVWRLIPNYREELFNTHLAF